MKLRRRFPVCKGQVDIWGEVIDLTRYKGARIETAKLTRMLTYLYGIYGSWAEVGDRLDIAPHLLRAWHAGKVQTVAREHAVTIVEAVEAHRKPVNVFASDHDVVRRMPSKAEADVAHREEQRAWRAYYRARARGEDVKPPGEKDTSRTRGRKKQAG